MILTGNKGKTFSRLYLFTALVHAIYMVIFMVEKCRVLSRINFVLIVCYLILAIRVRNVRRYNGIFGACTLAMLVFLLSHYIILGPSFGMQYLSIGVIPLIFFLSYVNGTGLGMARGVAIASYVVFCVVSFGCANIQYPLVEISEVTRRIVTVINITLTFLISIKCMTEFIRQTYNETGLLTDKNNDLEKSANIDALTGLRNRRSIDEYIERAIYLAKSEGSDFSILMCDLDNFKRVNDTYGHDCGDKILKNTANLIKSEIRPDDAVFRWGGEEILIVIKGGAYIAKAVAERCRKSIEESVIDYNSQEVGVTITIGGASYYQGATQDDLVGRADKNLYTGKENGKNQVVM